MNWIGIEGLSWSINRKHSEPPASNCNWLIKFSIIQNVHILITQHVKWTVNYSKRSALNYTNAAHQRPIINWFPANRRTIYTLIAAFNNTAHNCIQSFYSKNKSQWKQMYKATQPNGCLFGNICVVHIIEMRQSEISELAPQLYTDKRTSSDRRLSTLFNQKGEFRFHHFQSHR